MGEVKKYDQTKKVHDYSGGDIRNYTPKSEP